MSEETIQNPQAPLTLTNETIVGQAFLPVHLARSQRRDYSAINSLRNTGNQSSCVSMDEFS
jgi:hypothetical protein